MLLVFLAITGSAIAAANLIRKEPNVVRVALEITIGTCTFMPSEMHFETGKLSRLAPARPAQI